MHDAWTDEELDHALALLHAEEPPLSDAALVLGRRRLRSTLSLQASAQPTHGASTVITRLVAVDRRRSPPGRRHAPWLVAAATAGSIAAAATVLAGDAGIPGWPASQPGVSITSPPAPGDPPTGQPSRSATPSTALPPIADSPLNRAGDLAAVVSDPRQAPGQYLYVGKRSTHRDSSRVGEGPVVGHPPRTASWEEWIPVDRNADWMLRHDDNLADDDPPLSPPPGLEGGGPPNMEGEFRAPGGDYYANIGGMNAGKQDHWLGPPSEAFLAGLPREPRALYERLRADAMTFGNPTREAFVLATTALTGAGALRADLRAALYQALGYLPYMEVSQGARTPDGRAAVALSIHNEFARTELLVDPNDGQVIGQREVALIDHGGVRAGEVMSETTVTYAVVNAMGESPG